MSKMWEGVFERLDQISRTRALTEAESLFLEKAIRQLHGEQVRAGRRKNMKAGKAWSREEDARFCDLIANGHAIREAARIIGRTECAGMGRFARIREYYGWQAV